MYIYLNNLVELGLFFKRDLSKTCACDEFDFAYWIYQAMSVVPW